MSSTSTPSQDWISNKIEQSGISINAVQLLKNVSDLQSISQAREELERYYIKNFATTKGFFQTTFTEQNSTRINSKIVDEQELSDLLPNEFQLIFNSTQDISKNQEISIIEVTIAAICSLQNVTNSENIRLDLSNTDSEHLHGIAINVKDTLSTSGQKKKGGIITAEKAINQNYSQASNINAANSQQKPQQLSGRKKVLQVESDDEDQTNQASASKKLKKPEMEVEEKQTSQQKKLEKLDIEEDSSDDELFIANHLKILAKQTEKTAQVAPKPTALPQQSQNTQNSSKQKPKAAPTASTSKITSFFKKA